MDRLYVRIDFVKLRARLEAEREVGVGPAEVEQWLVQTGFTRDGNWHCSGMSLRHLHPDELIATRVLSTHRGVTFVDCATTTGQPRSGVIETGCGDGCHSLSRASGSLGGVSIARCPLCAPTQFASHPHDQFCLVGSEAPIATVDRLRQQSRTPKLIA